jgi:hypothetical protein
MAPEVHAWEGTWPEKIGKHGPSGLKTRPEVAKKWPEVAEKGPELAEKWPDVAEKGPEVAEKGLPPHVHAGECTWPEMAEK